jgi:hypothetical protein
MGEINQKRSGGDLMSKFNVNVNVLEVNNGDITKVEYNGIVFEKSADSIYRKVDRKGKVGDSLLFADGTASFITTGKYYEVVRVDSDGDAWVIDDDGDEFCNNYEIFEVYELISDEKVAEVEASKFSEGDYIKIVKSYRGLEGRIARITGGLFGNEYSIEHIPSLNDGNMYKINGGNAVLATDEEVAQAKAEQALKELEAKWAKIGRKPNEFKKGDIVRYIGGGSLKGELVEVYEVVSDIKTKVKWASKYGICTELNKDIELIAPVEYRFDEAK